ncbi:MAG: LytTR family DNA-binding domain-containing protein [Oscillospiraceae bacterium]
MQIAIVDDCEQDIAELAQMLEKYSETNKLAVQVQRFSSAENLLEALSQYKFEIIFLDIYMGGMDGMQAARAVYKADPACKLIFSTTSHAHAITSYEVHAAYYLTKPLDFAQFCGAMDAACATLLCDNRCIALHCAGVPWDLLLCDIAYVDCGAEHTQLHLASRTITVDEKSSEVLLELARDERFLSCNRNVMINMDYIIKTQDNDFLLNNGQTVPIRQRGRALVKRAFLQYSLRGLKKGAGI